MIGHTMGWAAETRNPAPLIQGVTVFQSRMPIRAAIEITSNDKSLTTRR